MKKILKIGGLLFLLTLSFLLFYFFGAKKPAETTTYKPFSLPDSVRLQTGDLILRDGKGFISDAFRQFSLKEAKYSHAGFISIEQGIVYVYHAIGGEENPSNKLRKELLSDFCDPQLARNLGFYSFTFSGYERKSADSLVKVFFRKGLEFDTKLDLETDDKMYCSEFIYKVLKIATAHKKIIPLTRLSGRAYVAIDNLYLNSYSRLIYCCSTTKH